MTSFVLIAYVYYVIVNVLKCQCVFSVPLGIRIRYRFTYSFVHGSNNTGEKREMTDLADTIGRHVGR